MRQGSPLENVECELADGGDESKSADLVRLIVRHQSDVYSYVLSLVPHWADAEEIVQETFVRIWQQQDQWDPDRDFRAWAHTIAYYQVLTFRKRMQRRRVQFSQAFVEAVAAELDHTNGAAQPRREALSECLHKMDPGGQELLQLVYRSGRTTQEVAQELTRTVDAVYKRLSRIRRLLHQCVNQTLHGWETSGGHI